jgi:beta-N-acetylhexosaminidase
MFANGSLEEKVGQMLGVGFDGLEAPEYALEWLRTGRAGTVLLFGRNIEAPEQVAALTKMCHEAAKYPLLIGIDQEGGLVTRLFEADGFTESPGAMVLGAANRPGIAQAVARILAREMLAVGINWTFAPVVDLVHDIANPSVSTRAFGNDPASVGRLAAAQAGGFQMVGVAATAKHFPGLGNTPVDTHEALAVINDSLATLRGRDLLPYRDVIAANVAAVMTTHVKFPELDADYPATLSPIIIRDLLRGELGYRGLICTDDMEMRAIMDHYGAGEAAVLAALAGVDVILFSHTRALQEEAYAALLKAAQSGRLPLTLIDAALTRIATVKARFPARTGGNLSVIQQPENMHFMESIAKAGIVAVHHAVEGLLPLSSQPVDQIGLIEFAAWYDSAVVERGEPGTFAQILRQQFDGVDTVSFPPGGTYAEVMAAQALKIAREKQVVILATRNAHLIPRQRELAARIIEQAAGRVILLALRNPYDIHVLPPTAIAWCTCGDSRPSLRAVTRLLADGQQPGGKLPVQFIEK